MVVTYPGLCPGPRQGPLPSVRNIKSASSLAHSASTCAFDLLTGLFIRTVHWTVLIPAPLYPAIYIGVAENILSAMNYKDEMGPLPHFAKTLCAMRHLRCMSISS